MKAIINPTNLLKELKKMSVVIRKNVVIPITSAVLFKFDKNKLTLIATDLETTYISTIDCQSKDVFSVPITFQDIVDICGNLSLPLEITVSDKSISFISGKSKFKLALIGEVEYFPLIPSDEFTVSFPVDGDFFYHLSNANTCKSKDDPRMDMAAIDIDNSSITIVATDSNVIYKKEMPIKSDKKLIVMVSSGFVHCCKTFQESTISIGEKFIKCEYKDEVIISRLSEQKFPNYRVILKPDINYNLTANREELKSALQSMSFAANFLYKQVVINFLNGKIKLQSQDIDLNKEGETEIEIDHSVETPEIGFNADKLIHLLSLMTCETVDFSFTSPSSSIYFKPSDDKSLFFLLQPVVINN